MLDKLVFYCLDLVAVAYCVHGRTEITEPKVQPVYVKSGDTLELICEHDDPFSLQWERAAVGRYYLDSGWSRRHYYQKLDTSSQSGFYMTSLVKDGRGWTNLTKYNVTVADAGSYKCSMVSKPDRSYAVDVNVLQADEISAVVTRSGLNAVIGCVVNNSERIRFDISWYKGSRRILDDNGLHYRIQLNETDVSTSSMLNITTVRDGDIGEYQCCITLTNGITLVQKVNVYTYPLVRQMSRSLNVVAGKTLELECRVWGWPLPRVTWQRVGPSGSDSRMPLNMQDRRVSLRQGVALAPAGHSVDNATLVITDLMYTDRDLYVCDVTSQFNNLTRTHHATVLVRVKGKFAPVWPLLGIIVEAVILCFIIFFHERKRARQRQEAQNKELDNHTENSTTAQTSRHYQGLTAQKRSK